MKRLFLILLLVHPNPLFAADLIDEIFEVSDMEERFEEHFPALAVSLYRDNGNADSEDVEIQEMREEFIAEQEQLFDETLSWESARSDLKALYLKVYSQEELEAYARFIRTDAGKSFMDKTDQIVVQYRTLIEKRAATFVEEKDKMIDDYRDQLRQYENRE